MSQPSQNLILGQGLAGSAVAWTVHWAGQGVTIVDRADRNSASRVAAGLITPVTGRRLVRSPEYDSDWAAALAFYRRVEQETGTVLFEERPMLRLFADEVTRTRFLQRSDLKLVEGVEPWDGPLQCAGRAQPGIVMQPAGRLDVRAYLAATRTYFAQLNGYHRADLNVATDVQWEPRQVQVPALKLTADRMIVCQGAIMNPAFPSVPNNPARGDVLTVRIPDYVRSEVVHRSVWIAPNSDGTQTVGATYDWSNTVPAPSQHGREEIVQKLGRLVHGQVHVEQHEAGVRPTMKDYEAVIGRHPDNQNLYVLNGLGSRGTLRAPALAVELLNLMDGHAKVPVSRSYERLRQVAESGSRPRPLTQLAQEAVKAVLRRGDTAIDATVGNGFDTCFLSEAVGPTGRVLGFDVQQSALEATAKRLRAADLQNVSLLHQGHETMAATDTIKELAETSDNRRAADVTDLIARWKAPAAVMFNLGFLPRSDHTITTQPETSTAAITAAIQILAASGVLTVLAYRGHAGGPEEFAAIEQLLQSYSDTYDLRTIHSTPAKPTAPVLFVLTKTSAHKVMDRV